MDLNELARKIKECAVGLLFILFGIIFVVGGIILIVYSNYFGFVPLGLSLFLFACGVIQIIKQL